MLAFSKFGASILGWLNLISACLCAINARANSTESFTGEVLTAGVSEASSVVKPCCVRVRAFALNEQHSPKDNRAN
jgi:hypothetical protein